jgi:glutathione peroxidase
MAFEADGPLRGDTRQCVASFRGGITSRHRALRSEKAMEHTDVWSFEAQTIGGQRVKLSRYRGKVLLIVNTASQCGFTPQFDGLQSLWQAYQDQGLVVLGFPSNEFGAQDPGNNDEIASFCQVNYGVSFPMMAKIEVNGTGAHPLYRWLTQEAPGLLGTQGIKWNFTKFLVGRDGKTIKRYAPQDEPAKLTKDIEAALAA